MSKLQYQSLWGLDQIVSPANEQVFPIKGPDGKFGLLTVGELRTFFNGTVDTSGGWGAARTITLTGGIATGSVSLDGTQDVSLPLSINDSSLTIAKTIGLASLLFQLRLDVDAAATAASSFRYSGTKTDHNFLPGMVICKDSAGEWQKATAADINRSAIAMVTQLTDANNFVLCILGRVVLTASEWQAITGEVGGLTSRNHYWLGEDGMATKVAPVTGNKQYLFYAENATTVVFNPGEMLDVTPGSGLSGPTTSDYATEAGKWQTARSITFGGVVDGTVSIDGSDDVSVTLTMPVDAIAISNVAGLEALLAAMQVDLDYATSAGQSNTKYVYQLDHDFIPGTPVSKSGLTWVKAGANSNLTTGVAIVWKVLSPNEFIVLSGGFMSLTQSEWNAVTGRTTGLPPGEYLYLSETPGMLTAVEPVDGIKQFYLTADTATAAIVAIGEPQTLGGLSNPNYSVGANWSSQVAITLANSDPVDRPMPVGGTIVGWTILGDGGVGSFSVDVRKCTFANYPTFGTICGGNVPQVVASSKAKSSSLTGWSPTIAAGEILRFHPLSFSGFTNVTILLEIRP